MARPATGGAAARRAAAGKRRANETHRIPKLPVARTLVYVLCFLYTLCTLRALAQHRVCMCMALYAPMAPMAAVIFTVMYTWYGHVRPRPPWRCTHGSWWRSWSWGAVRSILY
jgi:hypothetical protein